MFISPESFNDAIRHAPATDTKSQELARSRQQTLTKPPGSLGKLEELAIWLAGWQETEFPTANNIQVIVFAGNHGIAERGVSSYPPEVTEQMMANFDQGGAAINTLADAFDYELDVVPLKLDTPVKDWTVEPAMNDDDCLAAMNIGANSIDNVANVLVLGEMGIGNTTAAAAICAATLGGTGSDWAGPGTGLDEEGIKQKATIIDEGLAKHAGNLETPFQILRNFAGREIAALAGAILTARFRRIPIVLDGFVVTAAAAALFNGHKDILAHCVAGHLSAEPAHKFALEKMSLEPLLDMQMRLGEGTGAAVAANIIRAAAAAHSKMATFQEAGVSQKIG